MVFQKRLVYPKHKGHVVKLVSAPSSTSRSKFGNRRVQVYEEDGQSTSHRGQAVEHPLSIPNRSNFSPPYACIDQHRGTPFTTKSDIAALDLPCYYAPSLLHKPLSTSGYQLHLFTLLLRDLHSKLRDLVAIGWATYKCHILLMKLFLSRRANVHDCSIYKQPLLQTVIESENGGVIRVILTQGLGMNELDRFASPMLPAA